MAIPDAFLPATFLDAYVLAADDAGRRAALETQLVPNSPEALYARVVNALNRDAPDFKAAEDALNKLDALVASFKSRNGYENATLVDIARNSRHRVLNAKAGTPEGFKALADFYTSPSLSLARFDHAKPTNPLPSAGSAGSAAMYPASLDQSLIDPFKVMEKTIEEYMGAEGLEPTVGAFAFFARRLEKEPIGPETENKLRQLLDRPVSSLLAYYDPDTGSNLLPSVLSKLWTDYEDSRFDFLSEFIPRLTLNEVDGLAERFPELWAEPEYVGHYLRKLLPETPSVDQFSTSLPVWTEAIPRFCAKISSGPLLGLKLRIDLEYLDRVRKEQGKGEDFVRFEEYLRIPKRSPVGNRTIYDKFKKSKDFRKFGEQDVEARDSWSVLVGRAWEQPSDSRLTDGLPPRHPTSSHRSLTKTKRRLFAIILKRICSVSMPPAATYRLSNH